MGRDAAVLNARGITYSDFSGDIGRADRPLSTHRESGPWWSEAAKTYRETGKATGPYLTTPIQALAQRIAYNRQYDKTAANAKKYGPFGVTFSTDSRPMPGMETGLRTPSKPFFANPNRRTRADEWADVLNNVGLGVSQGKAIRGANSYLNTRSAMTHIRGSSYGGVPVATYERRKGERIVRQAESKSEIRASIKKGGLPGKGKR
jgi:hypothetical protein